MSRANWDDLAVRMGVGLALAAVGLFTVIAGGNWFHAFVTIAAGLMVWELVRMAPPGQDTMAISLGFGILFATTITLILVPSVYVMLEDVKRAVAWMFGKSYQVDTPRISEVEMTTEES